VYVLSVSNSDNYYAPCIIQQKL